MVSTQRKQGMMRLKLGSNVKDVSLEPAVPEAILSTNIAFILYEKETIIPTILG